MTNPMCCNVEMRRSEITKGSPLWCKICGRYGKPPATIEGAKVSFKGTKKPSYKFIEKLRRTAIEMPIVPCDNDSGVRRVALIHQRPFKTTNILIWGANLHTSLESMLIGTEEQLLSGLPALLFASPFNIDDTDINELSPATFKGLANIHFSTANPGQITTIVIKGKVSRVALLGITVD